MMVYPRGYLLGLACACFSWSTLAATTTAAETRAVDVQIDQQAGTLTVTVQGQTAFVYQHADSLDLPHFDPFNSPSGRPMTVKITDPYPHHRSFWVADAKVLLTGQSKPADLYNSLYSGVKDKSKSPWPVAPYRFQSEHQSFANLTFTENSASWNEKLTWKDAEVSVLDELRHYRVVALGDGEYFLDFAFELRAEYGDVTITRDNSHYAIPYIRMNDTFNVAKGGGTIVNSEGQVDQAGTDGKPASWVDYSAPLTGDADSAKDYEGLACFIHPGFHPPRRWLTRDYGTWGPRGVEGYHNTTFQIAQGESYDQRVGLLVHQGDSQTGQVAKRYESYAAGEL